MPLKRSEPLRHEPPLHKGEPDCVDSNDDSSFAIDFVALDGRVYGFSYSHLINYLFDANPEIQRSGNAPPERLTLQFSSHDVVITGSRLRGFRSLLRSAKIATISAFDFRYVNLTAEKPLIAEIVVTPIKGAL